MKWRKSERSTPELEEAQEALRITKETSEAIRQKESASKNVFAAIAEIRRRNHITEAVRNIMEAR